METNERDEICYRTLCEVFSENAYASRALTDALKSVPDAKDRAYISNLFYGILDKNVQLNYIIGKLVERKPKTNIEMLLKIGIYHLRYLSTPAYAAINETVNLAKQVGKGGAGKFVNAVLRKSESVKLPERDDVSPSKYLSVIYSVPEWIAGKLISEYGYEFAQSFLAAAPEKMTHIRYNSRVIGRAEFEKKLTDPQTKPSALGYYVTHNQLVRLDKSIYTAQSLSSMIAVNCYADKIGDSPVVLDLCGAPGGKSIYLEELCKNARIFCCDVHPHRVELIKKYAARMKSGIIPTLCDASVIFPEWIGVCDIVICDMPCSGLGVYKNKPDILLNKQEKDIFTLKKIQLGILETAKNYVKEGGVLCYSTCTVFKEENEDNIAEFLAANPSFELDEIECPFVGENNGTVTLYPHINDGCDGFFIARMRRVR